MYLDFPFGAFFGAIMVMLALVAALPPLVDEWLWWAATLIFGFALSLGPMLVNFFSRADERDFSGHSDDKPISADVAALVDAINRQGTVNRAEEKREDLVRTLREAITIFVLIFTAAAILRQVAEMVKVYQPIKDQSQAAVLQERTEVSAERARLFVEPRQSSPLMNDRNPRYQFTIANLGRTTALLEELLAECEIYDKGENIARLFTYNQSKVAHSPEIVPGGVIFNNPPDHECTLDHPITDEELAGLSDKNKLIIFKATLFIKIYSASFGRNTFACLGVATAQFTECRLLILITQKRK